MKDGKCWVSHLEKKKPERKLILLSFFYIICHIFLGDPFGLYDIDL